MQESFYIKRKDFIRSLSVLGIGLALPGSLHAAKHEPTKLTILHTNDWHSRIEPFEEDGGKYAGLGGAARRAALIKQIRAEGNHVLLLDAGDIVQGTAYFNLFGGELEYKLMTDMGYNAATLGNHDFDAGLEGLQKQTKNAGFSIICSNYDFSKTPLSGRIKPFDIFTYGKVKIGVLGIGIKLDGLVPEHQYSGMVIQDAVVKANETAAMLKKKGCSYIICLSHLGYQYQDDRLSDMRLAAASSNIDIILGGHTHTFLDTPAEIQNLENKKVMICQAGWGGIRLGRVDVQFGAKPEAEKTAFTSYKISEKSMDKNFFDTKINGNLPPNWKEESL